MNSLVLIAITHKTADIADLERVALTQTEASDLARQLTDSGRLEGAVVVSTCNRTEIYLAGPGPDVARCTASVAAYLGVTVEHLSEISRTLEGDAASRHLFTVAAGLDSRLVGEREILGQIRSGIGRAKEDATAGPTLESLFRHAIAAGRRARRTVAGTGAPSLAAVAVDAVESQVGGSVLVIGAGAVATALAAELDSRQLDYAVVARRISQAERLAPHPEQAFGFASLETLVAKSSVVFAATGARTHILSRQMVTELAQRRQGKPLTMVDLALPRNIDPETRAIDGVTLLDLTDLDGGDRGTFRAQIEAIEVEHRRYLRWLAGQSGADLIGALRRHVYQSCLDEIVAMGAELGLDDVGSRRLARRISGKLLHAPTVAMKDHLVANDEESARDILSTFGVAPDLGAEQTTELSRVS